MALPDPDTSVGHSFGLEFDGIVIKAIQEVSGLKKEQDVIELRQNVPDGKFVDKKLPGRRKAGEVTLTRVLTSDTSFENWVQSSQFGQKANARKGGVIIVFDYEGAPIMRCVLTNVSPKRIEIGSMKSGDTSVLTEKLTITYEEIDVEAG